MGYLEETGADEYRPTNFTQCLSLPVISGGYPGVLLTAWAPILFHEYARARGWRNPVDPADSPHMFAHQTDQPFFPYVHARGYLGPFSDHMGGYRLGCKRWMTNYFPVRARLIEGADEEAEAPFLVDMGGNVGHELELFRQCFPDHPGRLVLQDLPKTLESITSLDPAIQVMPHDLLQEQPVKGKSCSLSYLLLCWHK